MIIVISYQFSVLSQENFSVGQAVPENGRSIRRQAEPDLPTDL
jgi:hypothetical protein